jgi:hypothetical protein
VPSFRKPQYPGSIGSGRLLMPELAAIVAAPPLLAYGASRQLHFPVLFMLAGYCYWRLSRAGVRSTWLRLDWPACRSALPGILTRSGLAWLIVLAMVLWLYPGRPFCLASDAPLVMALISLGYALVSVLPQELVFRSYAGWRLDSLGFGLFPAMLISAALFGWVHILFGSWLAVGLSFAAGLVFFHTFRKTDSLAAVWVEHSLFGIGVFVLGLDPLFYQGGFIDRMAPACAL